jgi:hypothetical protein
MGKTLNSMVSFLNSIDTDESVKTGEMARSKILLQWIQKEVGKEEIKNLEIDHTSEYMTVAFDTGTKTHFSFIVDWTSSQDGWIVSLSVCYFDTGRSLHEVQFFKPYAVIHSSARTLYM